MQNGLLWKENIFIGKKAIIDNCGQVSRYFKSVSTDFRTLNIIADDDKVVINGTAEFVRIRKPFPLFLPAISMSLTTINKFKI